MTRVAEPRHPALGSPAERIKRRLATSADHLLCSGSVNAIGQPSLFIAGREVAVHRYLWAKRHGPIPDGHVLWNTCHVERCVAPHHHELITRREAALRGAARRWGYSDRCNRGHYFTSDNTYWNQGNRYCRTCRKENVAALRARKKEQGSG